MKKKTLSTCQRCQTEQVLTHLVTILADTDEPITFSVCHWCADDYRQWMSRAITIKEKEKRNG